MTVNQVLQSEFDQLAKDFIKRYDELGMRASGRWADGVETVIEDKSPTFRAKVLGLEYSRQLVNGQAPGRFHPIGAIQQWIKDKGIRSDLKPESLAFLIARKIAREGTKYYPKGTDLIDSVYTDERIQQIINKVGEVNLQIFTNFAIEALKRVAA
jgi:hypothetical protein